jgi:hypothetical protein
MNIERAKGVGHGQYILAFHMLKHLFATFLTLVSNLHCAPECRGMLPGQPDGISAHPQRRGNGVK